MGKIIEPSEDFTRGFVEFVGINYGEDEFSVAEAANRYFQERYGTKDKWTDPKNITGFVKRSSEDAYGLFDFVDVKKSKSTGMPSKHYKLRHKDET